MAKKKVEDIKPLSKIEVDIFMCRIQGALIEKDYDRIKKIQNEIKERLDELRK